MANTVKTDTGVEIYENRISELADDYIDSLDKPEEIKDFNKALFTGMLKYIYINYFKNNPVDNDDIELIDNYWNIYTRLCYKYSKRPTILNFSIMIGISNDTFNSWKNESTRQYKYYDSNGNRIHDLPAWRINHQDEPYRSEPSSSHSQTVKKWLKECESSLLDGAIENNSIGCIFALKANYGYRDNYVISVDGNESERRRTLEQIEQERAGRLPDKMAVPDADF